MRVFVLTLSSIVVQSQTVDWIYGITDKPFADVRSYSVTPIGNGTDATTAFQAAIATGKDVYIPPGDYGITACLTPLRGQKIIGAGRQRTFLFKFANTEIFCIYNQFNVIQDMSILGNAAYQTNINFGLNKPQPTLPAPFLDTTDIIIQGKNPPPPMTEPEREATQGAIYRNLHIIYAGRDGIHWSDGPSPTYDSVYVLNSRRWCLFVEQIQDYGGKAFDTSHANAGYLECINNGKSELAEGGGAYIQGSVHTLPNLKVFGSFGPGLSVDCRSCKVTVFSENNGNAQINVLPWVSGKAYSQGDFIRSAAFYGGLYVKTSAGTQTSTGSIAPSPATCPAACTDGLITWTFRGAEGIVIRDDVPGSDSKSPWIDVLFDNSFPPTSSTPTPLQYVPIKVAGQPLLTGQLGYYLPGRKYLGWFNMARTFPQFALYDNVFGQTGSIDMFSPTNPIAIGLEFGKVKEAIDSPIPKFRGRLGVHNPGGAADGNEFTLGTADPNMGLSLGWTDSGGTFRTKFKVDPTTGRNRFFDWVGIGNNALDTLAVAGTGTTQGWTLFGDGGGATGAPQQRFYGYSGSAYATWRFRHNVPGGSFDIGWGSFPTVGGTGETYTESAKFFNSGGITNVPKTGIKLGCSATTEGTEWVTLGSAGEPTYTEKCLKDSAGAYAWRIVVSPAVKTITAAYTLIVSDSYLLGSTSGGSFSVKLPSSPVLAERHEIKKIAAANTLTIDGNGRNIDGAATLAVTANNEAHAFVYDGTQWRIF